MFARKKPALVLAAAACAVALVSPPAAAETTTRHHSSTPISVVTGGLSGPRELTKSHGKFYVAESDSGEITRINPRTGAKQVVVRGLANPQGVAVVDGKIYAATGEADPDANPSASPSSAILVARPGQAPRKFADLLKHELRYNPDGQPQFGPDGKPYDALSNPFYLLRDRSKHGFLLVADAGANAVLKVDRRGKVRTLFVPPLQRGGPCAAPDANANPGVRGCDPVPTGLAYGPDGLLYVSALTAEAEGQGRVYVIHPRTGKLIRSIGGFSSPAGVAVDHKGTVYVSELLEGFNPAGPPPADPSTIGRIVKVPRHGARSYAQVTMPTGLLISHGRLYASAWSIAGFLGLADRGEVVRVRSSAFSPNS
jgi:outer membrane protein assembly factor BamB